MNSLTTTSFTFTRRESPTPELILKRFMETKLKHNIDGVLVDPFLNTQMGRQGRSLPGGNSVQIQIRPEHGRLLRITQTPPRKPMRINLEDTTGQQYSIW